VTEFRENPCQSLENAQLVIDRLQLLAENKRVPDITLELLGKVVDELPDMIKVFPWFLALTGCRIGEYLRLKPEHLKANVYTIAVPGTKTAGSMPAGLRAAGCLVADRSLSAELPAVRSVAPAVARGV